MTRKELMTLLGYSTLYTVSMAVTKAKAIMPSIEIKSKYDPYAEVSFSKEEIICIASCIEPPLNPIELELVSDNYIEHDKTYIQHRDPYIKGTKEFMERYKDPAKRHGMKCCDCCAYCTGKSRAGKTTKLFPFCKFYNKFISRMKVVKNGKEVTANIFVDRCQSFIRGEPILFKK